MHYKKCNKYPCYHINDVVELCTRNSPVNFTSDQLVLKNGRLGDSSEPGGNIALYNHMHLLINYHTGTIVTGEFALTSSSL